MGIVKMLNLGEKIGAGDSYGGTLVESIEKLCAPLQRVRKNAITLDGLGEALKDGMDEQNQHLEAFGTTFNELAASADEIATTNQSFWTG